MSKRLSLLSKSLHFNFSKLKDEPLERKLKLEPKIKSGNTLLCFDFDGTMVKHSLEQFLIDAFVPSANYLEKFLANETENEQNKELLRKTSDFIPHVDRFLADETKGWKNKELLVKLLKADCHIAIVSFCSYPDAIKYALKQLLGKEASEKILVVSYPIGKDMSNMGKQKHIEEAKDYFGIDDNQNVVLIDDNPNNGYIASNNGIHAIHVGKDDDPGYLAQAFKIVDKCTVSQDSLDQSTSTDSALELSGELPSDSDIL
jgi:FMN phosphatase YigB (HAD superfamily)